PVPTPCRLAAPPRHPPTSTLSPYTTLFRSVKVVVPKRGPKKELVNLAKKNANIAIREKFQLIERQEERTIGACQELAKAMNISTDRKSTRLNSSHVKISYAVFCLKKKIDKH